MTPRPDQRPKKYGTHLIRWRQAAQTVFFLIWVYIIWTTKYPLKGFVHPAVLFQLDPLLMSLTAIAERVWLSGWFWALLTLVVTLVWGRVFCGWFCPLGTVMDGVAALVYRFRRKQEKAPGWAQRIKYMLLGLLAALGLAGWQWAWMFDPLTIFVRAFSFNLHPAVNQTVDRVFAWALTVTQDYPPLEMFYYQLKDNVLDISHPAFPHAGVIGWIFLLILAAVLLQRRFWCRYVCPLGALLGAVARFSWYRRTPGECRGGCAACRNTCRTNAIENDGTYRPGECVVCFDCLKVCPTQTTRFSFRRLPVSTPSAGAPVSPGDRGISRAQFLLLVGGAMALTARQSAALVLPASMRRMQLLRPPGALPEAEFVQRCVRCGNCMKVCLTNVLQPAVMESGPEGIWTPYVAPAVAYCEYQCNLCGQVCPTGAIRPLTLEQKKQTKLGLAAVHRDLCKPWISDSQCLVCEEHCPVASKAIKVIEQRNERGKLMRRPVVDASLCVGCAICENKCPARPQRAITVLSL
ncbi:MAG: 4Fe-4S binding protein [Candidatus Firestonebacteria bacterium]|nr:4Fe-4S binding protein [Candidatus Firestonebacteria bacterium]